MKMLNDPENLSHLSFWTRQRLVFAEDHARWGARRASYMLLMRGLEKVLGFHVAVVNSRPLYTDLQDTEIAEGYSIRQLADTDYAALPEHPRLNAPADFIANARAAGGFCMGAFAGEELVAYVWRAFHDAPAAEGFRLRMAPHLRYGYKAMTLKEHRGRHLQTPISVLSDATCIDRGCTLGASYIATHNFASLASDARRGASPVGWIFWINKGGWRWCHTSAGARAFGLEIYATDKGTKTRA
ncbi:MAG: hypothetical protein AB8B93_09315 [Pseudomonadales bacterium]